MATTRKLLLETDEGEVRVLCGHCDLPFVSIREGEATVFAKHGGRRHENVLTMETLRIIAGVMARQLNPGPERW